MVHLQKVSKAFLILIGIQFFLTSLLFCYEQKKEFSPDQMIFKGDVVTKNNSIGSCTDNWLSNMPDGSIILGVKPTSCNVKDWSGVTAALHFNVQSDSFPIIGVLKISWPDRVGKGLHSPYKGKKAIIQFDGQTVWSKKTESHGSDNKDFYAAEHEPIQITVVIKDSEPHTFSFIVPEKTVWDISKIELLLFDYPKNLKGIGYSPFRDCQYPGGSDGQQPTIEQIREDLILLSHTCNAIRTYSSTGINGKVPEIAKSLGLKVYAGVSLDGNFENNKNDNEEIKAIIALAKKIKLDGIIVGNEYCLRHRDETEAVSYLLNCIMQVKEGTRSTHVPILTAEIFYYANQQEYFPILNEVDKFLVHIYPFWDAHYGNNQISIDNAVQTAIEIFKEFQEKFTENKSVIIGETGWPSLGESKGNAIPCFEYQRKYLKDFLSYAEAEKIDYMYFDAFDELWKVEEGLHGQHWGYNYSDRTAKYNFNGVLIPPDLITEDNIDIPEKIPFQNNISTIFKICSEWPQKNNSIKITDLSIKKITEICTEGSLPDVLNKFKNLDFLNEQEFFNSVDNELTKKTVIEAFLESPIDNSGDYSVSQSVKKYLPVEKCILKYSRYSYFFPRFMGNVKKISMYECDRCEPASGELSTKISFSFDGDEKWCGIYWLPMYDFESEGMSYKETMHWEDLPGVNIYDKMKIDKSLPAVLTFYARGEKGGEKVQFKVGGVKRNSNLIETQWVALDTEWKKYVIDLFDFDMSNVIGGFCCVSDADKNPGRKEIQFCLDEIQYEEKKGDNYQFINRRSNIFESDYYLLQIFGDAASRSSNFSQSNYNGGVFSGETRFIFPRFSQFLDIGFSLPDPFFSGALKSLKDLDWEDRIDYGIGLEWRPLSNISFFTGPFLNWIRQLRFYSIFLNTKYLQYQDSWSWRPKTDFRYGMEFYRESNLYNSDFFWSEIWADASWRKTNFYVTGYNSWVISAVPKVGIKLFQNEELCLMPYLTGEFAWTQRYEFWQNRILAGFGIRLMPFRWNETMMNVFMKGLRIYAENIWVINYLSDKAENSIPDYDLRVGINYTINWW